MGSKDQAEKFRRVLDRALERDRPKDAIEALEALERLEPKEPRWPQRLGDTYRRMGRKTEAENAYLRAVGIFSQLGFLPHAVAIAKVVVALNPARADVLDRISQQATRDLRRTMSGATRASVGLDASGTGASPTVAPAPAGPSRAPAPPVARPTAPHRAPIVSRAPLPPGPPPAPARQRPGPPRVPVEFQSIEIDLADLGLEPAPAPRAAPPAAPPAEAGALRARGGRPVTKRDSFLGGIPSQGLAGAARPLEPAEDSEHDEVRFEDVPESDWLEIDASDLEVVLPTGVEADLEVEPAADESWAAERLALFSGSALFAEVPPDALGMLARAADLIELRAGEYVCRHGEQAEALYVIVDGMAYVVLPWLPGGGVDLAPGQVFGEGCLLQGGTRQADVRSRGRLVLLRILRDDLYPIVERHPEVHHQLFDLLVQRLVANTLQTSALFSAFDRQQRRELAQMFEVRRAPAGVALLEQGKRSDGLYLLLAGEFHELDEGEWVRLPPGAMLGHRSLISHDPSNRTIRAASESVVLRMPARRFGSFAAQFPPAVAHLAELASRSPSG